LGLGAFVQRLSRLVVVVVVVLIFVLAFCSITTTITTPTTKTTRRGFSVPHHLPGGSGGLAATGRPSRRGRRSHSDGRTYDQGPPRVSASQHCLPAVFRFSPRVVKTKEYVLAFMVRTRAGPRCHRTDTARRPPTDYREDIDSFTLNQAGV
jgi:hypothetical protein